MEINKIYLGNNLDILKTFPDNSIDSVVTDPPYGLGKEPNAVEVLKDWVEKGYHEVSGKGFMGKEWDAFVPQPNFWKEVYRVLKPGGYVLSFAGTRTYDWMVMAVRLAGFEVRDMIAWVYGSGFPKSMDVGKAVEAKLKLGGSSPKHLRKNRMKGDYKPTGQKDYQKGRMFGNDIENDFRNEILETEQAKQWEGWGTALKPALEPIVMARKPLIGTVAENVMEYGTGGINIDGCRIPLNKGEVKTGGFGNGAIGFGGGDAKGVEWQSKEVGRFPANVIHDGSDEVVSLFPEVDGEIGRPNRTQKYEASGMFNLKPQVTDYGYKDSGSAARFFYVAKASKEERNFGLYDFEEKSMTKLQGRKEGSAGAVMKNGKQNPYASSTTIKKNIHPTVKPIELMRYLVRMVTPPNGICLDPYLGSGTTAIACKMEDVNYIGIELMPEYAEIAKARIDAVKDFDPTLDTKTIIKESIKEDKEEELGIQTIFDFIEE